MIVQFPKKKLPKIGEITEMRFVKERFTEVQKEHLLALGGNLENTEWIVIEVTAYGRLNFIYEFGGVEYLGYLPAAEFRKSTSISN